MTAEAGPKACFLALGDNEQIEILYELYKRSFVPYGLDLLYEIVNPNENPENLRALLEDPSVLFFLGVNGFPNIKTSSNENNRSLWEWYKKPYFRIFADPPFASEIFANIGDGSDRFNFDLVSDHMSFAWLSMIKGHSRNLYSIPLHGSYVEVNPEMQPINDREIDILFATTLTEPDAYFDRIEEEIGKSYESYRQIVEFMREEYTDDLRSDPFVWIHKAFQNNGMVFDINRPEHQTIMSETWHGIRMHRRVKLLKTLEDFPITFITNNMLENIKLHPQSRAYGSVKTSELLYLMSQSKVCICPPNAYFAFHERVPNAMFQKCIAVSAPSAVFEQSLVRDAEFVVYDDLEESLSLSLTQLLGDPNLMTKISENGRETVTKAFGVDATADRIFKIYMSAARKLIS